MTDSAGMIKTVYTYSFYGNAHSHFPSQFSAALLLSAQFRGRLSNGSPRRYDDLCSDDERAFLLAFPRLPLASRALLVRMLMRTGPLFRASKLAYDEIGCPLEAAAPLAALGWVDTNPLLSLDEIFSPAHQKQKLAVIIPGLSWARGVRKSESLSLQRLLRPFSAQLCSMASRGKLTRRYASRVAALCDRLRLMFFGNLRQGWSEFVLADLGVFPV